MGPEICEKFILKLDMDDFCINNVVESSKNKFAYESSASWCYVLPTCERGLDQTWGQGHVESEEGPGSPVKWRPCAAEEFHLRDKNLYNLSSWAWQLDLDVGLAAKFAYATFDGGQLPQVMHHFNVSAPEGAPATKFEAEPESETLKNKLKAKKESGETVFYASESGLPPFGISEGSKFYWVNFGDQAETAVKEGEELLEHPGMISNVKCVAGCETVNPTWWSPLNE